MSYNWKCCGFYPNNFGASALPRSGYMCTSVGVHVYLGRSTCVPRSEYVRTSVGVRAYLGRSTMTVKLL